MFYTRFGPRKARRLLQQEDQVEVIMEGGESIACRPDPKALTWYLVTRFWYYPA